MARCAMLAVVVVGMLTAGCATNGGDYHGRPFPATVNVPAGTTVYLVPNTVWSQYGERLFDDEPAMRAKAEQYRVPSTGVPSTGGPVTVNVEARTYTVVTIGGAGGAGRRTQRWTPNRLNEVFTPAG